MDNAARTTPHKVMVRMQARDSVEPFRASVNGWQIEAARLTGLSDREARFGASFPALPADIAELSAKVETAMGNFMETREALNVEIANSSYVSDVHKALTSLRERMATLASSVTPRS